MKINSAGEGRPLIFIHGFPTDQRMWSKQTPLSEKYRLLRLDLPGFGRSDISSSFREKPSMGAYADYVLAALNEAQVKSAVLCGLSMGGYILFECWRRFSSRIEALVFCDTKAEADTEEQRQARRASCEIIQRGQSAQVGQELMRKALAPSSLANQEMQELMLSMMEQAQPEGMIAALKAMHDRPDSTPTLPTITVPTLFICGAKDMLTPPSLSQRMCERTPHGRLVIIEEAGHFSPLENSPHFNLALSDFVEELPF